jgi:UDP-N-acetylglucosamine diphosphorylase/glucosamine-1-phosphate N-acetyltransferase
VPAGEPSPLPEALHEPERAPVGAGTAAPELAVEGEVLDWPWTLVERSPARLARDLRALHGDADAGPLDGVWRLGSEPVSLGAGAEIEPGVVIDTRAGPVRLDAGARVEGPARLIGPLHLGPGTVVFGGSVSGTAAGPVCKLRGEIADSVFLGHANKAHDGYLGHALVGRWVNLGALTTNSDLKNSYSPVRVELPHGVEETGLLKVGALLGDHVKTGIGTLLTTGAVVGAGSNLFGGGTAPRHVPPFSWGGEDGLVAYRFEKFVEVAGEAMRRRGEDLTPGVRAVLERAWADARSGP